MVVPAGDSLLYDDGFADDASEAMPELDAAPMPMDGDAAAPPEDGPVDGEATPEPAPFSVESLPLTPDQLQAFREHLAAELTPELESRFTEESQKWDDVRQSLEGKVRSYDTERLKASAWYAASQDVIGQLLQEVGADQTQQDAIRFRVQQLANQRLAAHAKKLAFEQTQTQQVQTAQTEEKQWFESQYDSLRSLMHAHAASVGLDPNNEEINQSFDRFIRPLSRAYLFEMSKPEAQRDPDIVQGYEAAKAMHKQTVDRLADQVKKRRDAKPSAAAVKRQERRGVQNLSRGAAGSAPMGLKDHIAALQRQHPNLDYAEIHEQAYANYRAGR
jgi:hypothetical protein